MLYFPSNLDRVTVKINNLFSSMLNNCFEWPKYLLYVRETISLYVYWFEGIKLYKDSYRSQQLNKD